MNSNQELIKYLEDSGVLKSQKIKQALKEIDRIDFVPKSKRCYSYTDEPLPLTEGQTISQPTTVIFMLELLNIKQDQKLLDIGAGSGWVSAILAHLTGKKGKVYAYEINPEVGKIGLKNLKKFRFSNIYYKIVQASDEWKNNTSYDRIHSGAAFLKIPEELKQSLKTGGILVVPTQDGNIKRITKISKNKFKTENFFGFSFVPFIE